jgi:asparagine synthetase B (glutamine-hydrolysing)
MVLSGEGSDEVFDGYLHFHKAPNRVSVMTLLHLTCNTLHGQCVSWVSRKGA